MAILGAYQLIVLTCAPYVRRRNDQLQQLVQSELLLLLSSANLLDQAPETEAFLDLVLSIVLLAASFSVLALFVYFAVLHVREAYYLDVRRTNFKKKSMQTAGNSKTSVSMSTLQDSPPAESTTPPAAIKEQANNTAGPYDYSSNNGNH
jgi:hypothetical protein